MNRYRRLIEKLIYLTVTRPDLSFALSVVSQFMQNPRLSHWNVVMRILKYLKGYPNKGLLYTKQKVGNSLEVYGFIDADWAESPFDRKPTSGNCIKLGGNLVFGRVKQNVVVRSSAKAEYRSVAKATTKPVWMKSFLGELGFPIMGAMQLWCDNKAAIHIAHNPVFHERTKHIK